MDEKWETILGPIPEAPGLEDLDELYPIDRIKPEEDDGPMPLPALPGMPLPGLPALENPVTPVAGELPPLEINPPLPIAQPVDKPKKSRKLLFSIILFIAFGIGYAVYSANLI